MAYYDNQGSTHSSFSLNNNSSDPRATHARVLKSTVTDIAVFNNLITQYFKSNLSSYALSLFNRIPSPNVVTWTALITAHSNTLHSLHHFLSMLRHSTLPNHRTVASLFATCASLYTLSFGLSLHALSLKLALSHHPFPASSLLTFYSKCRLPSHALKVFDETPHRDNVSYSAIIVALAQNFCFSDALFHFADMRCQGFDSTVHSVSGALRAAAQLAALEQCRIIHAHAVVAGLDLNVVVGTSLVHGYGKTGLVNDARQVFEDNIYCMNVVGWNAMLAGYAQQGDCQSTLELFDSMKTYGFVPDEYSFLAILTSLYNAGMFMQIDVWLNRMKVDYGLEPTLEHYTCLVGGVARVGQLERAERIASTMPFEPDAAVWRALLSACAYHGAVDKARVMARKVLELEPHDDSAFVIVANMLSAAGRWDDVAELRKMMKDRRVKKIGGRSWIEVQGKVHVFVAGDWKHERSVEIYHKLEELMGDIEKLGYVPVWDELLHNVGEEKSKEALWYHSEKLAVAFGVLCGSIPPGKALRIVKNLRICKDCHEAFKYMTRVLDREIIVRDVNRYHRFVNGDCTCRDIW
ncbi:pentatricopeptide repeat-containing protein At4g33170 [Lathyrus oleraceus]|nr:pentatricopeptide repeat-containing protein At4g33170-like [Pisum sativum]XP_050900174.1 pentatricopeptide repeat-containing protein At4g33170-like [Pisum sativum]XP_050900175.1 pentatricopeptide repeat-containing protein At4g33170-like [Pisum sativum]XP_050900176.1 pentatricopeptide repeat-containing protein At4g33170-like [Pisum sativum]XP_050900177.1 pentatricopeptide repeat-containing protein At4g33170-like [Pisum sativum]